MNALWFAIGVMVAIILFMGIIAGIGCFIGWLIEFKDKVDNVKEGERK